MLSSYVKALVVGLIVLGYLALFEVWSYVVSRRFSALRSDYG